MADAELDELVGKLAERLAHERLGACYCAVLVSKADGLGDLAGHPCAEDLEEMLEEMLEDEHAQVELLRATVAELGGEPEAVGSLGGVDATVEATRILALVADPRRSLLESLDALLVAKLADRASWEELVALAATLGRRDVRDRCDAGLAREDLQVTRLRAWLAARPDRLRGLEREVEGESGGGA